MSDAVVLTMKTLSLLSVHITSSLLPYCINAHQMSMSTLTVTLKIASLSSQLPTLSTLLLHGNKMQQITSEIFASVARYAV